MFSLSLFCSLITLKSLSPHFKIHFSSFLFLSSSLFRKLFIKNKTQNTTEKENTKFSQNKQKQQTKQQIDKFRR